MWLYCIKLYGIVASFFLEYLSPSCLALTKLATAYGNPHVKGLWAAFGAEIVSSRYPAKASMWQSMLSFSRKYMELNSAKYVSLKASLSQLRPRWAQTPGKHLGHCIVRSEIFCEMLFLSSYYGPPYISNGFTVYYLYSFSCFFH